MAKNRYHPFGYGMVDGEVVVLEPEAKTVVEIFQAYIDGGSYQAIAGSLSGGPVPYHPNTPFWNKHMVKRILENTCYTGNGVYQEIVQGDIFRRAAEIRGGKGWEYGTPPATLKCLRSMVYCAECGAPVKRSTGEPKKWACQGDGCSIRFMHDAPLLDRLTGLLNMLIRDPSVIEIPVVDISIQSTELTWMNSDIARLTNSRGCDEEMVIGLILAAAAEKYTLCDDGGRAGAGQRLRDRFTLAQPLVEFDVGLFSEAVDSVLLGAGSTVQVKLKNGQMVGPVE